MKNFIVLAIFMVALTGSAFAQGAYIQIDGRTNSPLTSPLDPSGNATILGVKPGNYQVALLVPAIQKVREAAASSSGPTKESMETMKKGWKDASSVDVANWSWGASYVGSANGGVWKTTDGGANREASAPSISEVVVTKNSQASKPSPILAKAHATGTHAQLDRKITYNGQEYYVIKLTDILISGAQPGSTSGDRPSESMSLNFESIKFTVK